MTSIERLQETLGALSLTALSDRLESLLEQFDQALLLEGGPTLATAFLRAGLVEDPPASVSWTIAPPV